MGDQDTPLVLKAKAGDQYAFNKLVKKYQDRILYLAFDLLGNYEDAQDIAQSAFLHAYQGIEDFKGEAKFSTWLFRIVVNLCIDFKRAQARRKSLSIERHSSIERSGNKALQIDAQQMAAIIEQQDFGQQLEVALDKLPHHQRIAFVLRQYHDLPMDEIARVLNCKPGTVRSHLFKAIQRLRNELKHFSES